jgi:hypothetical protein
MSPLHVCSGADFDCRCVKFLHDSIHFTSVSFLASSANHVGRACAFPGHLPGLR